MSIMGDTTFWFLIDRIGEIGRMHSFVSVPDCTVKREKSVCAQSNNNYIRFSLPLSVCLILRNRIAFSSRTQLPKRQIACTRSIHSIAIRISLAPRRRMRLSAWENPMNMKKKLSTKSRIAIRRCIYSSEADWRRHPPNVDSSNVGAVAAVATATHQPRCLLQFMFVVSFVSTVASRGSIINSFCGRIN